MSRHEDKARGINTQQEEIENLMLLLRIKDVEIDQLTNKLAALESHSSVNEQRWDMGNTDNLSMHYRYNSILETIKKHEQNISLMDLRVQALTSQIHIKAIQNKKMIKDKQKQEELYRKDFKLAQLFQKRKNDGRFGPKKTFSAVDLKKAVQRKEEEETELGDESKTAMKKLVKGLGHIRRSNTQLARTKEPRHKQTSQEEETDE
jgi:hypothetical protein